MTLLSLLVGRTVVLGIFHISIFQGASIIRMMRFFLGDPVFQHGMTVSIANIRVDYKAKF